MEGEQACNAGKELNVINVEKWWCASSKQKTKITPQAGKGKQKLELTCNNQPVQAAVNPEKNQLGCMCKW